MLLQMLVSVMFWAEVVGGELETVNSIPPRENFTPARLPSAKYGFPRVVFKMFKYKKLQNLS